MHSTFYPSHPTSGNIGSIAAPVAVVCLFLANVAGAAFTNSGTLSATANGTNLVIGYSLTTTQGWVTLLEANQLEALSTNAKFVSAVAVPPSRQGQFVVPRAASPATRFYRLLLEEWPSHLFNYPDLSVILPPGQTSIAGTGTNRQFLYTHDTYNGGAGPLTIQPDYHPASGNYLGTEEIYFFHDDTWTLVRTNPVAGAFVFHAEHGHFHFPFARFGLYYANPDGSVGPVAALSEKTGFCIADSFIYNPDLPNAGAFGFSGSGCSDPATKRGLSIGAVDEYNLLDPGQSIYIPGLPDGRYWLRAVADPDNLLHESNENNNETFMELTITNDTVIEHQIITPVLTPPPGITLNSPAAGIVTGLVQLEATPFANGVGGVQFLLDGLPLGSIVSGPPYILAWDTATVPDGAHWLAAQTTDLADHTGTSGITVVTVLNGETNPPVVVVTGPEAGAIVSAVVTLSANAASQSGTPTVQFYVDGSPVGLPLANPPFMSPWNTLTVPDGLHIITATATAQSGLVSTSEVVSVTVDNSNPPNPIGMDTLVFRDTSDTMVSPAFSTSTASNFLVAFTAYDGPPSGPQTATVSGAGLLWQLAMRSNIQRGTAEIWVARATNLLSSVTVTAEPGVSGYNGSLTVIAFTNASGPGILARASAPTGAPEIYIPGARAGSWVFAVGNDWDGAVARTPVAGQLIVHERVDTQVGNTFWVQTTAAPLAGDSLVVIRDTAPTNHQWNYAAFEIVATRD